MKRKFIVEVEEGTTIGCCDCKLADYCISRTGVENVLIFLNCSKYNLDTIKVRRL